MEWIETLLDRALCKLFPRWDIRREKDGPLYIRRWFIYGRPGDWEVDNRREPGWLVIHHILLSDTERDPHSHPGEFTTWILHGSYIDEHWRIDRAADGRAVARVGPFRQTLTAGDRAKRGLDHVHRILVERPVWTLVWMRPVAQQWGFVDQDGEVTDWRTYAELQSQR